MGPLQMGQGVGGRAPPRKMSPSLASMWWRRRAAEHGEQRQRWPQGWMATSTSAARHTLQVYLSSRSEREVGELEDLERRRTGGVPGCAGLTWALLEASTASCKEPCRLLGAALRRRGVTNREVTRLRRGEAAVGYSRFTLMAC